MNEHTARILAPKTKPVKDTDLLGEYVLSHWFCALCGDEFTAKHVHHIIGGRGGRSDERCNIIRVCFSPCHLFADLSRNLGAVLFAKHRLGELSDEDKARLQALHGRTLPDIQEPWQFKTLWSINMPPEKFSAWLKEQKR